MSWKIISEKEINTWNEKLKNTDAVFAQYPYYLSSEYNSVLSKAIFIKYIEEDEDIAFAAVIELGVFPFKVGVIDSGPVLLKKNVNIEKIIAHLKKFALNRSYMHLQMRPPANAAIIPFLQADNSFNNKLHFPFHLKVEFDLNIYNKPENELLSGFKLQCRRKIVLAGRVPYKFFKVEDEKTLAEIRRLFKEVRNTKGYGFLPFKVYEAIYKEGKKYGLCDFYTACLDDKPVNVVLVVKDGHSFYHYTSALSIKGYNPNESPPAKLHFFIMQDCFYNENKDFYNISFGGSDNLIRFKELFNPVEIEKPPYYTFIIKKNLLRFLSKLSFKKVADLRRFVKTFNNRFY
ncbi:MAG: hypothetical protein ABI405_08225 [Parafilimonas sp.]